MISLLLVDADADRRLAVWDRLVEDGYRVDMASGGRDALARAFSGHTDLVVLDLALPDASGLDVCRELRRRGFERPLILLTDGDDPAGRALALRQGADDVLGRPFELSELVARVEACLRRGPALAPAPLMRRVGGLELDVRGARVLKEGRAVPMSPCEFRLLRCLVEHAGTPLSRAELLDHAWGHDAMPSPQTVDVHIAWLRRKLEPDPRRPTLIRTVHGVGYVLDEP